ncbi:hypothetical protein DICPUDRAFT_77998 [Dictyostelium purpureum]|uniref:SET domain-containing protein n=1 Tax=Dictyostelium purpureum TaxID=5786 RepID=F0ZI96_DICPU|nr:uncharacterized protein DICPUDRAFT_77998 [Dictyostelium purpureum]EGC36318.1 hypothetical protein DICPUDRAFT_77998 [Dictyostelium purpureum]|eukprot:XP_003287133.1 hypothetical protein DICPUDRAFT_77998 [Dictyostelium purpureum]
MSYEYFDNSDRFTLYDIQDIEYNPWIEVKTIANKGRCIYSKKFIPKGTIIFKDIPHSAIVDNQYKKNICNTCFKLFLESNRHNIITCPSCGEVNYCSEYCKQFSKIDTRHFELECKWIHEFSISYKYQLSEDDRNIVLLILKILARRIYEKKPLVFHNPPISSLPDNAASSALNETNSSNEEISFSNVENLPMIPNEVQDLIDHLDEYLANIKNSNEQEPKEQGKENELLKYSKIWKNDLKKLINTSLIIRNLVIDSIEEGHPNKIINSGFIDSEGDSEMTDFNEEPKDIKEIVERLTDFDLNILRLLCKIRSNYFGLWHTGYKSNLNKPIFEITETMKEEGNNETTKKDDEPTNQYMWCGSAVYLKLSLFNHGCFPNCTTLLEYNINHNDYSYYQGFESDNRLSISIITLRDVPQNSELLITYIPLNQKGHERYHNLKSNWMFPCDCLRCFHEKTNPELTEKIFNDSSCKNSKCSGGLLLPIEPNSNEGICRVCKTISAPLPQSFGPLI